MRLGIIGGIHEDVIRLRAALKTLERSSCDAVACLGDIVGFSVPYFGFLQSRDAHEAVRLVREHCRYVVAGNHDLHAVRRLPHHTIFDYPTNWYELDLPARRSISRGLVWLYEEDLPANLNDGDTEYLRSLPELLVIPAGDVNVLIGHFAYPDLVGDSQTSDPAVSGSLADHFEFMRRHECTIGLAGHDPHDGAVVHTMSGRLPAGFGVIGLPTKPVWVEALSYSIVCPRCYTRYRWELSHMLFTWTKEVDSPRNWRSNIGFGTALVVDPIMSLRRAAQTARWAD
jgi:hypothetical protein